MTMTEHESIPDWATKPGSHIVRGHNVPVKQLPSARIDNDTGTVYIDIWSDGSLNFFMTPEMAKDLGQMLLAAGVVAELIEARKRK